MTLPTPRGTLTPDRPLADLTWLRAGGPADWLFQPADAEDLAAFLRALDPAIPVFPMGVGSNLIVRDGGIRGVVIRLGRGFNGIAVEGTRVTAGAAALDAHVARRAAEAGVDLTFLRTIPGSIGGAVRMNAGCYGTYVADVLVEAPRHPRRARGDDPGGGPGAGLPVLDLPEGWVLTGATFDGPRATPMRWPRGWPTRSPSATPRSRRRTAPPGPRSAIRRGSQSTGRADDVHDLKAWKLIEEAGMRGARRAARDVADACEFPGEPRRGHRRRPGGAGRGGARKGIPKQQVSGYNGKSCGWAIRRRLTAGTKRQRPGRPKAAGMKWAGHKARTVEAERWAGRAGQAPKVAVLMGGPSAEREVSLSSGRMCAQALRDEGYGVVEVDCGPDLAARLHDIAPDVAFNALHGRWGEDGCVQGLLEWLRIPYTHSGVLASALAMDKERTKAIYRAHGLPVVDSLVAAREDASARHLMAPPYVVKPVNEGSSVGHPHRARGDANRPPALPDTMPAMVMVEAYVPGAS
jgi:UDP-N-acetylmuramate dehydrogenase